MHWIWDLFLVLYQHLTFRFKWHVSNCRSCTFHLPLAVQVLVLHSVTERKKSRKRKRAKERKKKGENGKKYNLFCYHYSPPKKKLRVREITVIFTHHFLVSEYLSLHGNTPLVSWGQHSWLLSPPNLQASVAACKKGLCSE